MQSEEAGVFLYSGSIIPYYTADTWLHPDVKEADRGHHHLKNIS